MLLLSNEPTGLLVNRLLFSLLFVNNDFELLLFLLVPNKPTGLLFSFLFANKEFELLLFSLFPNKPPVLLANMLLFSLLFVKNKLGLLFLLFPRIFRG